jgi:hypothetical protein
MNKIVDLFVLCCIGMMCIGVNKAETEKTIQVVYKVDTLKVTDTLFIDTIKMVDTVKVVNKINKVKVNAVKVKEETIKYTKSNKEWSLFDKNWQYKYDSIRYTNEELILLTNILLKESTSADSINQLIDQYLVVICAIRRLHGKHSLDKRITRIEDIILKCSTFLDGKDNVRYKQFKRKDCHKHNKKDYQVHYKHCESIVLNVLNCNIPAYVPYVPEGTFFYWNSRIDTNIKQKKLLKSNKCVIVASTIKDHHFYTLKEYMSKEEWEYVNKTNKESYFVLK